MRRALKYRRNRAPRRPRAGAIAREAVARRKDCEIGDFASCRRSARNAPMPRRNALLHRRIALARERQRQKREAPVTLWPGLCLMRRHASLCCGFVVELSPHRGTKRAYTLPRKNQGPLFQTVEQFEIDSQAARWKTFPRGRILSTWSKITPSRSGLNPIFCAMAVSAGRSTKTDSLAIDPPSRTLHNAKPWPTLQRRWRSILLSGGGPDDEAGFTGLR